MATDGVTPLKFLASLGSTFGSPLQVLPTLFSRTLVSPSPPPWAYMRPFCKKGAEQPPSLLPLRIHSFFPLAAFIVSLPPPRRISATLKCRSECGLISRVGLTPLRSDTAYLFPQDPCKLDAQIENYKMIYISISTLDLSQQMF